MPWLMKAEPDSRVVKGKDVKVGYLIILSSQTLKWQFSVDDFEKIGCVGTGIMIQLPDELTARTSPWDGEVLRRSRNHPYKARC